jgi:uncharacterized membrane protein YdjX (TVP38/TMEM64 family)
LHIVKTVAYKVNVATRFSLVHLDKAVSAKGWKAVLLIRLSPVAPFGMTTYLL